MGSSPFSSDEMKADDADVVVVHIKVMSSDPEEVRQTAATIKAQVRELSARGKRIACIISGDGVEATMVDVETLATLVTPSILKRLGMTA